MFLLFFPVLAACAQPASLQLRILPQDCSVTPGEQVSLALDGTLPQNAKIQWQASQGSILSAGLNISAVFTAPSAQGDVTISAIVETGTPHPAISRICHVVDTAQPPANPGAGNTQPASIAQMPTLASGPLGALIISEIMGNPCGGDDVKKWNQYVELYNNGNENVDVGGWFLADAQSTSPDSLVAWDKRNPGVSLPGNVITNTTLIPPGRAAIVLSPIYHLGLGEANMPYRLPAGSIVLTVAEGDRIGDDVMGLQSYEGGRDVLVLYIGGNAVIEQVVSTYGSPALDVYPQNIRDDRKDALPLDLKECASAERAGADDPDQAAFWRQVLNGSPGEVPYLNKVK